MTSSQLKLLTEIGYIYEYAASFSTFGTYILCIIGMQSYEGNFLAFSRFWHSKLSITMNITNKPVKEFLKVNIVVE